MNKFLQFFSLFFLLFSGLTLSSQNVGINSTGAAPDAGSLLDITSTNKGLLIPRVSIANLTTIAPITGSATTSMLVYNTNAGTGLGYYYWDGADWIRFTTGGVTGSCGTINYVPKMTSSTSIGCSQIFDNGTNVGIGTVSPGYKLHTIGDIYANGGWLRVSGNRGLYFESWGGGFYMTDGTWIRTYGNKNFYHNTGIMRTDGTLQVGGSGNYLKVPNGGTGAVFNEISANYDFRIESDGNANMFILDAGLNNIGIGVVPNANNNTLTALQATTTGTALWANTTANTNWVTLEVSASSTTQGTGVSGTAFTGVSGSTTSAGGWSGYFDWDTYIDWMFYTGATLVSDKRLKSNISKIDDALGIINKLKPVSYDKKRGVFSISRTVQVEGFQQDPTTISEFGFLAQDVEEVLPQIVKEKRMLVEGKEMDVKGVNYEMLIPITVKAVQEQQLIIEEQNKRIDNLEKIIKELQGK